MGKRAIKETRKRVTERKEKVSSKENKICRERDREKAVKER